MAKNLKGLEQFRHSENQKKEKLVIEKLNEMAKIGTPISIASISKLTGVSRKFIYNRTHLVEEINIHREKCHTEFLFQKSSEIVNSNQYKSLKSKYETVLLRNSSLREEAEQLKSDNSKLRSYIEQIESKLDKISALR